MAIYFLFQETKNIRGRINLWQLKYRPQWNNERNWGTRSRYMEAANDWATKGKQNCEILPYISLLIRENRIVLHIPPFNIYIYIVYYIILQNDLVALLLNGIRYDRLGESGSKTAGGYQVNYCNMSMIYTLNV